MTGLKQTLLRLLLAIVPAVQLFAVVIFFMFGSFQLTTYKSSPGANLWLKSGTIAENMKSFSETLEIRQPPLPPTCSASFCLPDSML